MAHSGSVAGRNASGSGDAMAMSTMFAGDNEVGNGKTALRSEIPASRHAAP